MMTSKTERLTSYPPSSASYSIWSYEIYEAYVNNRDDDQKHALLLFLCDCDNKK